ncbi:DJ-1/PfpI family protein [Ilumatobacter fluminis]|uniref:DJ-1/PfpI family protein n=1 Tax=Ilumatobacter fluminis TaxID=467091 RepID=A0A4R7I4H3_9ACTN|nr:DJ-1/PfpI family protein [Ilumatobacter fluminis]TDT18190.1 DJ-1/PfpI family protein [Ilumatobacter fluminis]
MRGKRAERLAPGSLPPIASRATGRGRWIVGVFVYRGVSSSEIDEPVQRLTARLDADIVTIAPGSGSVHGVEPSREIEVDHVVDDAPPVDVLVVPGGLGWKQVIDHAASRDWLARAALDAKGILAISTGSLLLASVGRLDGRDATGHWLADADLAALGAIVTGGRTAAADEGRVATASGALAALQVVDELATRSRWVEWMRP